MLHFNHLFLKLYFTEFIACKTSKYTSVSAFRILQIFMQFQETIILTILDSSVTGIIVSNMS